MPQCLPLEMSASLPFCNFLTCCYPTSLPQCLPLSLLLCLPLYMPASMSISQPTALPALKPTAMPAFVYSMPASMPACFRSCPSNGTVHTSGLLGLWLGICEGWTLIQSFYNCQAYHTWWRWAFFITHLHCKFSPSVYSPETLIHPLDRPWRWNNLTLSVGIQYMHCMCIPNVKILKI
jgi:hypothetical protein